MDINELKENLQDNPDIKFREIKKDKKTIYIIYIESICDSDTVSDFILRAVIKNNVKTINSIKNSIPNGSMLEIEDYNSLYEKLYMGFSIICVDNKFLAFETKGQLDSGIQQATNEKVIKGPKDSFSENYQKNLGLIRKRIRTDNLKIKEYIIGTSSKTKVSLIYVDTIAKEELINKIDKKLKVMTMDYVANSNYIIENLEDKNNILPTNLMTERPDLVSFELMEGRVAVLVENTPQVVIIPAFFSDFVHTMDDYYQNTKNVSVTRIIRLIALFLSITIPAIYIALTTYNQEALPTGLLINFSIQRAGVPFPSIVEALILWLTFEILKESDTRIPFVVGTSMSIVGALVLGQAAVDAGMVSPIMIIVIAISSVSSFLFNDNDMVNSIRIWKLIFLLLSGFVGLYGLFIASLIFLIKLCSMQSYGFDYTFPTAPFVKKAQKDNFILTKKYKLNKRNKFLTKNVNRR